MNWEIGKYLGEGAWEIVGTAENSLPQAALENWLGEGDFEANGYGVRKPGQEKWHRYGFREPGQEKWHLVRVGASGRVTPVDVLKWPGAHVRSSFGVRS